MIIHGDCLEEMRKMPENSIDFIVTDPPYGLYFMGKNWDGEIPSKEYWQSALKIAKPGSMMAAFGGSRTHHRLMYTIEDAGWEIRDVIMWIYGSGFPKSHNHFGLPGYGTALKPAYEPIILAMKSLDGTYVQNVEKWGLGGINIDESRIETNEKWSQKCHDINSNGLLLKKGTIERLCETHHAGRWPANIILDEEAGQMLDEQTGNLGKSLGGKSGNENAFCGGFINDPYEGKKPGFGDFGGASRFFYCAKASTKERGEGNNHPTVKPISLMKYIIKLLAPPGKPILLDPFAGSGTTLIAAKELGIDAIGIEKEKEYHEIAERRIANAKQDSRLFFA